MEETINKDYFKEISLRCNLDGDALQVMCKDYENPVESDAFWLPIPKELMREIYLFFYENTKEKYYMDVFDSLDK